MTKKEMVIAIKQSNKVIDFDEKYLMRKSKRYLTSLYNHCKKYVKE